MRIFFPYWHSFSRAFNSSICEICLPSKPSFDIFSVIPHARFRHTSHLFSKSLFLKLCLQIFIILYTVSIHRIFLLYAYIMENFCLIQALMRKNDERLFLGVFSNRSREKRSTDNYNVLIFFRNIPAKEGNGSEGQRRRIIGWAHWARARTIGTTKRGWIRLGKKIWFSKQILMDTYHMEVLIGCFECLILFENVPNWSLLKCSRQWWVIFCPAV